MSESAPLTASSGMQAIAGKAMQQAQSANQQNIAGTGGTEAVMPFGDALSQAVAASNPDPTVLFAEGIILPEQLSAAQQGKDLPQDLQQFSTTPMVAWSAMFADDNSQPGISKSLYALNTSARSSTPVMLTADSASNADNPLLLAMNQVKMQEQIQPALQLKAGSKDLDAESLQSLFNNGWIDPSSSNSHSAHNHNGLQMTTAGLVAPRGDAMQTPIPVGPDSARFNQALTDRVQWMVNQNMSRAEIRLDPPELGTLEVRISMNNDQANITFSAPNAHVREAVEAASARLREMFADAGLSLGDVNVSQESFAQHQQNENSPGQGGSQAMADDSLAGSHESQEIITPVRIGKGLVDTYA